MSEIIGLSAREILDSRGNPTVEVEVYTTSGSGRAAVPWIFFAVVLLLQGQQSDGATETVFSRTLS